MTETERLLRKELRLSQRLFQLAQKRIKQLGILSFNEYIRTLIYSDVDEHREGEKER